LQDREVGKRVLKTAKWYTTNLNCLEILCPEESVPQ
jgi:hypothetical protein